MQGRKIENIRSVHAFAPKDITGAGVDGDWVSLKFAKRCQIILSTGAWAGGTAAVTVEQATDNASSDAKALALDYYYISTGVTDDSPTKTAITSNTFNLSAANKLVVLEIHAQDLDMNNGFTHIRVRVASPGSNADLLAGVYDLYGSSYAGKADTLPSVIA